MTRSIASAVSPSWPLAAPARVPRAGVRHRSGGGRVAFGALIGLTFIALFAPQLWIPALAAARPGLILMLLGGIAVVMDQLKRGERLIPAEREMRIMLALMAWALVTMPWSYWPGGSFAFFTEFAARSFVAFWLIVHAVNTPARHWRIAWILALLAFPPAEAGIENFMRGVFFQGSDRIYGYRAGLTANPNDLALVLNLLLPVAVALVLASRRPFARLVLVGLIAMLVTGIVVTFSRGGFITLAAIMVTYLVKLYRQGRSGWAWMGAVGVLLALPLLPGRYLDRITTMSDIDADPTGSAQERWQDQGSAVRYLVAHPVIGAGIGQATLAMNAERGATWRVVHNMYLEAGVELGLPGLAMFVMLVVGSVKNASRARRSALEIGDRTLFLLAEGLQVSLIAFAVGAVFHPSSFHFLFYYLAGLAVALRRVVTTRLSEKATHAIA